MHYNKTDSIEISWHESL